MLKIVWTTDYISSISFTIEEVYDTLVTLDPTKAPGIDLIPPKILQMCMCITLCQQLHYLFNMSLRYAHIPSSWKIHKIVPIFKVGDKTLATDPSHYFPVLEKLVFNKV